MQNTFKRDWRNYVKTRRLMRQAWAAAAMTACALFQVAIAAPAEEATSRLVRVEAMFQERRKTAGEKIYKTVENVEGIFLMKLRPEKISPIVRRAVLACRTRCSYQRPAAATRRHES